jgi:hypothetical protein
MAIDIANETIVGLAEATRLLPKINGRHIAISSLWRWCTKGVGGVKLEYVCIGRRMATSKEALNRFCNARAEAQQQRQETSAVVIPQIPRPSPKARERALQEADRILAEAGI